MEYWIIGVLIGLLGLSLGSFAGATVWRLRGRQLIEDKQFGEEVDAQELKKLKGIGEASFVEDRSICLHCGHRLAWYDLLPLASWVLLGGKCRYCKKPIGWFEPAIEAGVALLFIASYFFWPHALIQPVDIFYFAVWLVVGTGLAILFAYDARWFLLPDKIVFPIMGIAFIGAIVQVATAPNMFAEIWSILFSCAALSGLYFTLFIVSKGEWVGFGDIKLGLVLALLLGDWQLAVLALFLANVIGSLVALPALMSKKLTRHAKVPFGPMLIAGAFIAGLWGERIIQWYLSQSLGLY